MEDPRILAETIPHQRVKLNSYGDESGLRREDPPRTAMHDPKT